MKRNLSLSLLVVASLALAACNACPKEKTAAEEAALSAGSYEDFGAGLQSVDDLTGIPAIVKHPERFADEDVTVKGIIASVCPSSGCFLYLGAGSTQIEVDLKEAGFTIPPGQNIGKVAFAVGPVRVSGDRVKIAARGLRILDGEK